MSRRVRRRLAPLPTGRVAAVRELRPRCARIGRLPPPPVKSLEEQHKELRAMRKRQQQDRLERERQFDPDSIEDSVFAAVEAARENDRRKAELWRAAHR